MRGFSPKFAQEIGNFMILNAFFPEHNGGDCVLSHLFRWFCVNFCCFSDRFDVDLDDFSRFFANAVRDNPHMYVKHLLLPITPFDRWKVW